MRRDASQRREEARKKRRRRLVRSILAVVVLLSLGYLVFFTDIFLVESIEFLDYKYVDEEALLESAGLETGKHIFFLDTGEAVVNLQGLGYVESASIVRVFPDQVKIYITPREPAFILKQTDGYAYVDSGGVVAEIVENPGSWDLPLVTGMEEELLPLAESENYSTDPSWIGKEATSMVDILMDEELIDYVTEIQVTQEQQFHLYTKGGSVIKIADSENMKSKIDFLYTYLREKDDRMVIDLTHGGNPTYTPR